MIVRWFLGWPMLGCRPTSDCRSNRRRKANASIPNPGEPLRWSQAVRIRAPCSAVRGRVPVSGIFRPGSSGWTSCARCCVVKSLNTEDLFSIHGRVSDFEGDRYFFYLFFVGMYGNYTRYLDLRLPRAEAVI
jgi:hypothetical protein